VEAAEGKLHWSKVPELSEIAWPSDFSPDGKLLVGVHHDESLQVYDLTTGERIHTWRVPPGGQRLAHHPRHPHVALSCPDDSIRILDYTTGREVLRLPHSESVYCLAWQPAGDLLAVAGHTSIQLWDVRPPHPQRTWAMEHRSGGLKLAFSAAGDLLASCGWSARLKVWNPYTGQEVFQTTAGDINPRFGLGDRLAMCFPGAGGDARPLTQVEKPREFRTMRAGAAIGGAKHYRPCDLHSKGRLLAVGTDDGLSLIDLATGGERALLPIGETQWVLFEPSGSLLTKVHGHGLLRWPLHEEAGNLGSVRIGPPEPISVPAQGDCIAQSPDGTWLAQSDASGAYVWRRDRPELARLLEHWDCRRVHFSPDGRLVATASHWGTGLKIWEVATGRLVIELLKDGKGAGFFSADGQWLAANCGQSWRVGDWSEGPANDVVVVASAPDRPLWAVVAESPEIRLVDPATGKILARLEDPHQHAPSYVTFSPDGTLLLVATTEGLCVHVWDLRLIRARLAELGLDWDQLPYPPVLPETGAAPLTVEVDYGHGKLGRRMEAADPDYRRASVAVSNSDHAAAIAVYGELLARSPRHAAGNNNLAWLLATCPDAKYRDAPRAVELANQAVALAPQDAVYWNTLGVAHYRAREFAEAVAALAKSEE
jgi:WD40 repeat protein